MTKNRTLLLLIFSLLIITMASVSASDVSDISDNQNYISVNEDSTDDDLAVASVDSDSIESNSDSISSSQDVSDDSDYRSSDTGSSITVSQDVSDDSDLRSSDVSSSNLKSSNIGSSNLQSKASNSSNSKTSNVTAKNSTVKNSTAKNSTSIVSSSTKVIKGNKYSVTLKDKNGNALSSKKLVFTYKGKNYTRSTNSKGIARLTLNAKPGNYLIAVKFLGDDLYGKSSLSQTVTIKKIPTVIKESTKYPISGKKYAVALKDKKDNPLSSKKVTLHFNGKTYNKVTNSKGIVKIALNGKVAETYKLTYKFAGDNSYRASSGSVSLKLKMPTKIVASNARVVKGKKYAIALKDSKNKGLSKKKLTIHYNGKTYTRTTDSKGVLKFTLNQKPGKNYKLTYNYKGNEYYGYSSKTVTVFIKTPTELKDSGSLVCKGNVYHIALKDYKNEALPNKTVKIKYNGKTFKKTTNAKGLVGFKVNTAAGKTYNLSYSFAGNKKFGPSSGSLKLRTKVATKIMGSSDSIIKGKKYKITLKNGRGTVLPKKTVTFTVNGKTYKRTTSKKGVASLAINLEAGKTYKLSYKYAGSSYYNKSSGSVNLAVKLPSSIKNSGTTAVNNSTYTVTLKDSNSKGLANKVITFKINGKTYKNTTNSKGVASIFIVEKALKKYKLTYKFAGDSMYGASSGSVALNVKTDKVFTFNQIVAASKKLRKYVEKNHKLPAKISVNGIKVNMSSFAYLMSKAVVNVNNSKKSKVSVVSVSSEYSNKGDYINANLYRSGYIKLANKLINYTKSKHHIPNYINTNVGSISPDLYIFGLSKSLDFYSDNKYLPNYVILKSSDVGASNSGGNNNNGSQYKKGLNEKQSLNATQLSKYLKSSGNDALNAAIKDLAKKLVSGKSTTMAKANAIFKYVRDNVDYEYYADTRYKATGTLSKKRGNCCDHANLVVALCRAANIPARYSHAQGCTFSSGLVTGHVWAQVYVNGVWYTADATSSRNSLGNIHNWNTNYYNSLKQYTHLPF